MVRVKICGITNLEDAMAAVSSGADALGFIFYPKSPRYIDPENAASIIKELPPFVSAVGVFVDEKKEYVEELMDRAGLDVAQFHGNEPADACLISRRSIKAIRVRDAKDLEAMHKYDVSAYLLDAHSPHAPGGTGEVFNWDIAVEAKKSGRIILAGGLTPGNIEEAVRRVRPYAVDVASGVESSPGRKDHDKVRLFVERAKGVDLKIV